MPVRRLCGGLLTLTRRYTPFTDLPQNKVAIIGANGGIGQPLSLMLKRSAFVAELALHDIENTRGLCADLSHISTKAIVRNYIGKEQLANCLAGSSIVVILAGKVRKPGMHRDDLFDQNAATVAELTSAVADYCPEAQLCLITSPVNSNVPLAAEILKKRGVYDPRRLYGITALDSIRANVLLSQLEGAPRNVRDVPIVGGHSANSIVPLLSQVRPRLSLSDDDIIQLTEKIRKAADTVVEAKAGRGSATLSVASAVKWFLHSLLRALDGSQNVIVPAYVQSSITRVPFFSSRQLLGRQGIEKNLEYGSVSDYEAQLLETAFQELEVHIEKGIKFGQQWS